MEDANQEWTLCMSSPPLISNFPACSQLSVTAAVGNVAHRNKELWHELHCEAGSGDLEWSLERPEQKGDICLAGPAAETASAWGNVWN